MSLARSSVKLILAAPRGFCAGVERAIMIVERAIECYGAPVYVRHEIVHNGYVVKHLEDKGAIFVEELSEIPDASRPVIFSAHGVAKSVPEEAKNRNMFYLDATCPLVSKVHFEAEHLHRQGYQIILIGHAGHPEVIGTLGQLPPGNVTLIETIDDVSRLTLPEDTELAYITQTTLSVDDTHDIVTALCARFPNIRAQGKEDICYATTNRQEAVKMLAPRCDALLIVGAANSSNSRRLVEVGQRSGCSRVQLIARADVIDWRSLEGVRVVGLTAGASAPEVLVQEAVAAFEARYDDVTTEEICTLQETVKFNLPSLLRDDATKKPSLDAAARL